MSAAAGAPPSCFFNIRNRAGLFLNNLFTCVAECLERMLVATGVITFDDDDVMAICRPMAGVIFVTDDLTAPNRDILLEISINYSTSTRPPTNCMYSTIVSMAQLLCLCGRSCGCLPLP